MARCMDNPPKCPYRRLSLQMSLRVRSAGKIQKRGGIRRVQPAARERTGKGADR